MQDVADQSAAPTTIGADLCADICLVGTEPIDLACHIAVARPRGEDVQAQRVCRGYLCAASALFQELRRKACARTGKSFPILGSHSRSGVGYGFWIHRVLLSEGIESHVVDAASIATSRAGGVGPRPTGSTARLLLRALLAHKRGEPRVCSMVRAWPTPEDEDRRRICRERKVLIMERVQHVNRIKGSALFSQGASGYEPLRRDRRARLDGLHTGDGRRLPQHLKEAQVCRELDRLELLLEQIKAVEAERDALLDAQNKPKRRHRRRCCWVSMALGLSSLRSSGLKDSPDTSITADRSPLMPALPRRLGKAGRSIASRRHLAIGQPATTDNDDSGSPGFGYAISRARRSPSGSEDRMERHGGRRRKTTIVALARKLLVALWEICERWGRDRRRHD